MQVGMHTTMHHLYLSTLTDYLQESRTSAAIYLKDAPSRAEMTGIESGREGQEKNVPLSSPLAAFSGSATETMS